MSGGVDLFTLAVAIDSSGSKTGADLAVASAERIKAATTGMHQTLQQTPVVLQSLVDGHQRMSQEVARTERATTGLSSATQQGIDRLVQLRVEMQAKVQATRAYADRVQEATAAAARLEPATTSAASAFAKLRAPLQTATFAMAGLPGPAGRVVSTLGQFAVGGGLMLAATAGVAALSAAWDAYSRDAREAEERTDRLIASLVNAHDEASGLLFERQETDLLNRLLDIRERIKEALEVRFVGNLGNLTVGGTVSEELQEQLEEINKALTQLYTDNNELILKTGERGRREAERAAAERRRQLEDLVDAELSAEEKLARMRGETGRADALALDQRLAGIERQVAAAERLTAAEKERLRGAGLITLAVEQQEESYKRILALLPKLSENAQVDRFERRLGFGTTGTLGTSRVTGPGADFDASGVLARALARQEALSDAMQAAGVVSDEYRDAIYRQVDAQERARLGVLDLVDSLGIVPGSVLDVADAIIRLQATATARRAEVSLADIGNAEFSGGKLRTEDFLGLAGAAVGLVQGILSARRQAELEAARFRAATADWERSITRFADSIGGQSQLQRELQGLEDRFLDFAAKAADRNKILIGGDPLGFTAGAIAAQLGALEPILARAAGTPLEEQLRRQVRFLEDLAKARELETRAIEEARRAFAEQEYAFRESLEARLLDAQGRSAEAEFIRLQARQRGELLDAQRKGYDAVTLAILAQVQALDAERLARQQSIDELNFADTAAGYSRELQIRQKRLGGDETGAQSSEIEDRYIDELNRLQGLFRDGLISADDLARWNTLIEGERDAAKKLLQQRIDDAEAAIRAYNRAAQSDLEVRRLIAVGDSEHADRVRRAIDQERELARYREEGASIETITILRQIQELETLKVASDRAAEAEAERIRLLEKEQETQDRLAKATEDRLRAERKLGQDLDVRYLQALGQDQAADDLRRQVQNARELEDAVADGLSQSMIDYIRQVQEAERLDDLRRREDRIVAALDPEAALRPERTTSFDGRSITSSQADTMAAYLATIAINTGQLVRLAGGQPTTITRGATGAGGQALGGGSLNITIQPARGETPGQALDRVLASQGQLEAAASGTPPPV